MGSRIEGELHGVLVDHTNGVYRALWVCVCKCGSVWARVLVHHVDSVYHAQYIGGV